MNKKLVISMGLSFTIKNVIGKMTIIELYEGLFVVGKNYSNISLYLNDAKLKKWHPVIWFKRLIYKLKIRSIKYLWAITLPDFAYAYLSVSYKMKE